VYKLPSFKLCRLNQIVRTNLVRVGDIIRNEAFCSELGAGERQTHGTTPNCFRIPS
jgi:hypothetical protein